MTPGPGFSGLYVKSGRTAHPGSGWPGDSLRVSRPNIYVSPICSLTEHTRPPWKRSSTTCAVIVDSFIAAFRSSTRPNSGKRRRVATLEMSENFLRDSGKYVHPVA